MRRRLWIRTGVGIVAGALAISLVGLDRAVGVAKFFVPGSIPFLLLGLGGGALLLFVRRKARPWAGAWLLALGLAYLLLSMPVTAKRLASVLYGHSPSAGLVDAPAATTIVALDGDHGLARVRETVRLYGLLRPKWVVVSGDPEFHHWIIAAGVPQEHILWENQASTTREQALHLAPLLDRYGIEQVVLVASPLHMPRALGACQAAGIRALPSPSALPHASVVTTGFRAILPSREALRLSWESIYEYLALGYYRARGWLAAGHP